MVFKDVLRRLYEYGWTKNVRQNPHNQRCLIGAFVEDNKEDVLFCKSFPRESHLLAKLICKRYPGYSQIGNPYLTIVDFNDNPDVTFEHIEEILKEAIKIEEEVIGDKTDNYVLEECLT